MGNKVDCDHFRCSGNNTQEGLRVKRKEARNYIQASGKVLEQGIGTGDKGGTKRGQAE